MSQPLRFQLGHWATILCLLFHLQPMQTSSVARRIQQQQSPPTTMYIIEDPATVAGQPQLSLPPPAPAATMGQNGGTGTSNTDVQRAASFMVDPLIIIALIALPTIGMLGLSSLVMPLIPIGIYLIQQFFPTGAVGRRRRRRRSPEKLDDQPPPSYYYHHHHRHWEKMLNQSSSSLLLPSSSSSWLSFLFHQ